MNPLREVISQASNPTLSIQKPQMEEIPAEPPIQAGEVSPQDIETAANYGIMVAFARHRDCEPMVRAQVALQIMESLYAMDFSAKVSLFIKGAGQELLDGLKDPAQKTEFTIRVARMMDPEYQQGPWCQAALELLQDEKTRNECPKSALEMFAMIWVKAGDKNQAICWLAAAASTRDTYKEAAFQFFLKGAFDDGLAILDKAPLAETPDTPHDFTELVAYSLRRREVSQDPDFLQKILPYQKDPKHQVIILKMLCHLSHTKIALDLAKEFVLNNNNIHLMHVFLDYITEIDERRAYIDTLILLSQQINKRENETGTLNYIVTHWNLSISEVIAMAPFLPSVAAGVTALWNQTCRIILKENKEEHDLIDLQAVLQAMIAHLGKTIGNEYCDEYWGKVLDTMITYGFLADIKAAENTWRHWRQTSDTSQNKTMRLSYEIQALCYFGILKYLDGNINEAIQDFNEGAALMQTIWEEKPIIRDELCDWTDSARRSFLKGPLELTASQKTVFAALVHHPRKCQEIFKSEKDLFIITPLVEGSIKTFHCLQQITALISQPMGKRVIQSLQPKKLSAKVLESLEQAKAAANEALQLLPAYYNNFTDEADALLAKQLNQILNEITSVSQLNWSLHKIKETIIPLENKFHTLVNSLKAQHSTLYRGLEELTRK